MHSQRHAAQQVLTIFALLLLLTIPTQSAPAAPFRVTFFEDPASINETLELFKQFGLSPPAATNFKSAISNYLSEPISLDRSKFPAPRGGWYSFPTLDDFIHAMPRPLWQIEHNYGLTCFDSILLLNLHNFKTSLRPSDVAGPFLPPHTNPDGGVNLRPAATAKDAYELQYPEWIRSQAAKSFDTCDEELRISLMALLFSGHPLPLDATETTLPLDLRAALRTKWSRFQVTFPKDPQILLVHQVDLQKHLFITVHAGGLIKNGDRLLYFEKSGGAGPYLLFDISALDDLKKWIEYSFGEAKKHGYSHIAVTVDQTTSPIIIKTQ